MAKLLALASEGDGDERARLFEWVRPRLELWAATRLPVGGDDGIHPAELAHDTMSRGLARFSDFRGGDVHAFLRWLFSLAEGRLEVLKGEPTSENTRPGDPPAYPTGRSELARLRDAIRGLSQEHRDVLRVMRFEGCTTADTAERLGLETADVTVRYYQALTALRRALAGGGE